MILTEHDIIQNIGIGAIALQKFTNSYYQAKEKLNGPELPLFMPVLPILYHKDSLMAIYKRGLRVGLYTALAEYRDLPAGLQDRIEAMSGQTFDALNLAFSSKLLAYDKLTNEVYPIGKNVVIDGYDTDIKDILKGADRLGQWFATMSIEQICMLLKIKF